MSKYSPLSDYLSSLQISEIRLTFEEIEKILGSPLPISAEIHREWWSNSSRGPTGWPDLWKLAGWMCSSFDQTERWSVFRRLQYYLPDSDSAREGYEIDRTILVSARNSALSAKRKALDNHTCQVCQFQLQVSGQYVIEVHHLEPLATTGETITRIKDLVSLCPTCHRIAHLRNPPYDINEIKKLRAIPSQNA